MDVTPSRKPSLTFPEIRLTHSPSCLLDGLPTRLETQCLEIGNGVLVSLFPVPMSKASLSFTVCQCWERKDGLENKRKKQKCFQQVPGLKKC